MNKYLVKIAEEDGFGNTLLKGVGLAALGYGGFKLGKHLMGASKVATPGMLRNASAKMKNITPVASKAFKDSKDIASKAFNDSRAVASKAFNDSKTIINTPLPKGKGF